MSETPGIYNVGFRPERPQLSIQTTRHPETQQPSIQQMADLMRLLIESRGGEG